MKNYFVEIVKNPLNIPRVYPSNLPDTIQVFQEIPKSVNIRRTARNTMRVFIKAGSEAFAGPVTVTSVLKILDHLRMQTLAQFKGVRSVKTNPGLKPIVNLYGLLKNKNDFGFYGDYFSNASDLTEILPDFLTENPPTARNPMISDNTENTEEPLFTNKPTLKRIFSEDLKPATTALKITGSNNTAPKRRKVKK